MTPAYTRAVFIFCELRIVDEQIAASCKFVTRRPVRAEWKVLRTQSWFMIWQIRESDTSRLDAISDRRVRVTYQRTGDMKLSNVKIIPRYFVQEQFAGKVP